MSDYLNIGKSLKRTWHKMANMQTNTGATLPAQNTNGDGNGNANVTTDNQGSSTDNAGTDPGSNGDDSGDGSSSGSGDGSGTNQAGNFGFDGEFNPERARTLIDTLRSESNTLRSDNKRLSAEIQELKELIKGSGKATDNKQTSDNVNDTPTNDSAALEEIRRLREEMAEEKLAAQFMSLATSPAYGMRPEAVELAFTNVRQNIQTSNGIPTNLTDVLATLKANQSFLFVPQTSGQNVNGSVNGATSTAHMGAMPNTDEGTVMRAFGIKDKATYDALASGQRPASS